MGWLLTGNESVLERVSHAIDRVCGDDFYAPDDEDNTEDSFIVLHKGKRYRLSIKHEEAAPETVQPRGIIDTGDNEPG